MASEDLLDVVDEMDTVVGVATRGEIHARGLLHREVHVWLCSGNGDVFFQLRGSEKDTYPNLFDASAGGHVDRGQSYGEAAVRELEEETGLHASPDALQFIAKIRTKSHDPRTGTTNNVFRAVYTYRFDGDPEELRLEAGEIVRFERWPIAKLSRLSDEERKRFVPFVVSEENLCILREAVRRCAAIVSHG